ncbi:hypothetical protein A4X09_0g7336 [Tilletia walkeri]|uniref:Uncharacterized protein n=1 Tax=Tilletia walkeri TaxID=117179 RepID=A0A8X7N225_9BASI|nr:hypothetical protein A4X09_0g7336 [Tilletia walkeri]
MPPLSTSVSSNKLQVMRALGERVFDTHPHRLEMLESELDAFLREEERYSAFNKPRNHHAARKSRKKPNARSYTPASPTHFDATFTCECSCSGEYRQHARHETISPQKKRITGGGNASSKVKCPAKIVIRVQAPIVLTGATTSGTSGSSDSPSTSSMPMGSGREEVLANDNPSQLNGPPREDSLVDIIYYWRHEGHSVGTIESMASQRNNSEVRRWIEDQVLARRSVKEIMASIRLDMDELSTIVAQASINAASSTAQINASIRVRYHDVANAVRRLKNTYARLDPDALQSLRLWSQRLSSEV